MSATERHRQKRRLEREQLQANVKDSAKTNPSSLKLPMAPDDHDVSKKEVIEAPRQHETVVAAKAAQEQNEKRSVVNVRTITIAVAGVSTIVFIASSMPPL